MCTHLVCSSGSKRCTRLYNSAANGDEGPPVDTRYLKKPYSKSGDEVAAARADIISYLNSLYESLAETLPDSKDETFDNVNPEAMTLGSGHGPDSYSLEFNKQAEAKDEVKLPPRACSVKPPKIRKRRSVLRGVRLNTDRTGGDEPGQLEIRWLPPGSMSDIWSEYVSVSTLEKPPSFPTFWRVAWPLILMKTFWLPLIF